MMNENLLYAYSFFIAVLISVIFTPICIFLDIKLNILDVPTTKIKTHKVSTLYLGGIAIAFAWTLYLLLLERLHLFLH
jgi:UDP-N-acetylmuramyl pentapeptide phosphotransferase/UDP-N-acetylglucosamine-1-phosphate transferase